MRRWPAPITTLLRLLGGVYLGYLALSLVLVLPLLNAAAPWAVREFLGRELRHELLLYNPFMLALELRGAEILEPDGHRPLALRRLRVDLSLASLWRPGIVLDALQLQELDVHVLRHADGRWHFDDLIPASGPETAPAASTAPPAITVSQLQIDAHTLRFTDRSRPGGFSAVYHDLELRSEALSTVPERRGDGRMALRAGSGGRLTWDGELWLGDGRAAGQLQLENLELTHLWRYVEDGQPFVAHSADLDLALDLAADWSGEPQLRISDGSLRLHGSEIRPRDPQRLPDTSLLLEELRVDDIAVDTSTRRLAIDRVALRGLLLQGFDRDGQPSLQAMFLPPAAEDPAPPAAADAAAAPPAAEDSGDDPWQLSLDTLSLDDSRVEWRSALLQPTLLQVEPLRFSLRQLSWPAGGSSALQLALGLNGRSQLAVEGSVDLVGLDGELDFDLQALPLDWFNPALDGVANTAIDSGRLSLRGGATLRAGSATALRGELDLADFALQIPGVEEGGFGLDALAVRGATADLAQQRVEVAEVALQAPRAALHILEDGSFSVTRALPASGTGDSDSADAASSAAPAGAAGGSADAAAAPWQFRIDSVALRDGQLDFSDAALPLPFEALIGDINADIGGIDSSAAEPLEAVLTGAVDGYAPVRIEAGGLPFAEPRELSLQLDFEGLDIATMSPYSGTYAGYSIDSGSLSADLGYRLNGTRLEGENRLVVSQMRLGEAVESERAVQLPLKLGLALLTDTRGVIDLDVPISGDVGNPEFSLGRVIGRTLGNIIVKAATAPFRLLAGLVNTERDLENVAFPAGSSELDADARAALAALSEALQQRPGLQLSAAGGADPAADLRALRRDSLEATLLADGLAPESLAARDAAFAAAVAARYAALPQPAAAAEAEPAAAGEEPAEAPLPSTEQQFAALLAQVELPANALRELGTRRATAVKRELVTAGSVDAARIAVSFDGALGSSSVHMGLGG